MFKSVEDFQKLGQSQVEAATASAAAVSRGMQQMASEASSYAKRSVEDGSAATSRLLAAKSLDGAVRVQADYAKAAFEGLMAQATRMSALMMSVGKDAAQPFEPVTGAVTGAAGDAAAPLGLGGRWSGRR